MRHQCLNCKIPYVRVFLCLECWRVAIIGAVAVALIEALVRFL